MMFVGGGKYGEGWNDAQKKSAEWLRKQSEEREAHENIVAEVEKATGKKCIVVDGKEIYVNKTDLSKLINRGV